MIRALGPEHLRLVIQCSFVILQEVLLGLSGTVWKIQGSCTLRIKLTDGMIWRWHINHIHFRSVDTTSCY